MTREIKLTLREEYLSEYGIGTGIHGMCCPRTDDFSKEDYLIVLNADLTGSEMVQAFIHEMIHIYHDDIRAITPEMVQCIEWMRHKETAEVTSGLKELGVEI